MIYKQTEQQATSRPPVYDFHVAAATEAMHQHPT
jgi:hypothetical protein